MNSKNTTRIILFGKAATDGKVFFDSLANLELPHSIIHLRSVSHVSSYLASVNSRVSNILIFYVSRQSKVYLNQIRSIREVENFKNLSILLYDPAGSINEEEAFTAGANIYMHKPKDTTQFKIKLRHLFGINCQYLDSNLNNETFFLSV